jgi:hypothetical protein
MWRVSTANGTLFNAGRRRLFGSRRVAKELNKLRRAAAAKLAEKLGRR